MDSPACFCQSFLKLLPSLTGKGAPMQKTATSDQALFDQMTALYPDWVANQSWLMFGFPQ